MLTSPTLHDEFSHENSTTAESGPRQPGLVLIFSDGQPAFEVIPLDQGAIELSRGSVGGVVLRDKRMSKPHARITFDGQTWSIEDLGSRNGSGADGQAIPSSESSTAQKFSRTGRSLFLLAADVRRYRAGITRVEHVVMGPVLQSALEGIRRAACWSRVLLITGERGSELEFAARVFHDAGPASAGPFVVVNAATLEPKQAAAMLFGTSNEFSFDAPDGPGLVQAAKRGTLFCAEVGEFDAAVQAELLRVVEKCAAMDRRFCLATHADLGALVANGQMRSDLHSRIATPTVALPPLRERLEEMPWCIERVAREVERSSRPLEVHVSFVEACMLRPWPGNGLEFVAAVKNAAHAAVEDGGVLFARHLDERAGT